MAENPDSAETPPSPYLRHASHVVQPHPNIGQWDPPFEPSTCHEKTPTYSWPICFVYIVCIYIYTYIYIYTGYNIYIYIIIYAHMCVCIYIYAWYGRAIEFHKEQGRLPAGSSRYLCIRFLIFLMDRASAKYCHNETFIVSPSNQYRMCQQYISSSSIKLVIQHSPRQSPRRGVLPLKLASNI